MVSETACPHCGGRGQIINDPCGDCRGSGTVRGEETLKVKVPAGVATGEQEEVVDQLADRGETFQSIATQARRDAAESLLATTSHPIADVAFLTGFSDQTAFTRAFKRWTGVSPSHWRAAQRAAALGLEPSTPAVIPSRQY